MNCKNLTQKTNLRSFTVNLLKMLNDQRIIIRSEVQHVLVLLSYVSIKHT